ncbi:TPA: cell division protein SepF [bacterium]|nr:cell division protein SepF [bacterium]
MPFNNKVKPFVFLSEQTQENKVDKPLSPKDEDLELTFPLTNKNKIVPFSPSSFEAAKEIGKELLTGAIIVLSLNSISSNDAVRLLDFISGIVFVFNGIMIQKSETEFEISIFNPN